jgi:hypothetical protein
MLITLDFILIDLNRPQNYNKFLKYKHISGIYFFNKSKLILK